MCLLSGTLPAAGWFLQTHMRVVEGQPRLQGRQLKDLVAVQLVTTSHLQGQQATGTTTYVTAFPSHAQAQHKPFQAQPAGMHVTLKPMGWCARHPACTPPSIPADRRAAACVAYACPAQA